MTKLKDADCIVSCVSLRTASRKVADILKYTNIVSRDSGKQN
jgi:hypothetical protein